MLKSEKEINISNVNEILNLVGWGEYTPEQWKIVIDKSTFMVEVLHQNQTIGFARVVDDTRMCMIYDVCVHPDYQKLGVNALILAQAVKVAKAKGIEYAETGPELEENNAVRTQWDNFDAELVRKRRLFTININDLDL